MRSLTQIEVLLPELRAYARSICERPDQAEDFVQDAIERSLRSDTTPNNLAALRPWMFRVIRNLYYDELRRMRVRREYLAAEKRFFPELGKVPDHAGDVMLRLGYERLPPDKREVLFLVDIMGLKYAEAAEIMGVAHGTVMSRLSRARQALRAMVDADPADQAAQRNRMPR